MTATQPILVCVVDDDDEIRNLLSEFFESHGLEVLGVAHGDEFLRRVQRCRPDVAILDVMMPGTGGFEVLRRLREDGDDLPVIVLTSHSDRDNRIAGLDLGADDYVGKPFDPDELLARVRAVLRRKSLPRARAPETDEPVSFGHFVLDPRKRSLCRDGQPVALMPAEYALLRVFILHPMKPLSRERLLALTGAPSDEKVERSIDSQIRRLRRLIEEDPDRPVILQTVRGVGYVFVP